MVDFTKIKTYPLSERKSKVTLEDFKRHGNLENLLHDHDLISLGSDIRSARDRGKQVIWMMGAHLIKLGLSPYVIDLMKRDYITHVAMNGAGPIHDFEIAYAGHTSEDVGPALEDGTFGLADETGRMICDALKDNDLGYGSAIGRMIEGENFSNKDLSILSWAYHLNIPVTVHTAVGAEIIYEHPACDGAALGRASYEDFKKLTETISKLDGGVVVNVGSAVMLPEVFLKSLAVTRNLGYKVENFTAANLDMLEHYRPKMNVLSRPTSMGGTNYDIREKHENTIPSLHYFITGDFL
ncbi:MAG: hypothetical protein V1645_03770 [archaeon]